MQNNNASIVLTPSHSACRPSTGAVRLSARLLSSVLVAGAVWLGVQAAPASGADLPIVTDVELQPLSASVKRMIQALEWEGAPLSAADRTALEKAMESGKGEEAVEAIQKILDPHCLFGVNINPEMRVKVQQGNAAPELVQKGWRPFLVKVENECGTKATLNIVSPQAETPFASSAWIQPNPSDVAAGRKGVDFYDKPPIKPDDLWLEIAPFEKQPLVPTLSGLRLEYRLISLSSRDAGKRDASFGFDVGLGTQDLGFRAETHVLFTVAPAREIKLHVLDENGVPTTGALVIHDAQWRTYPSTAKRLAPDMAFQSQIYRADGETILLPDGEYTVDFRRGPESVQQRSKLVVSEAMAADKPLTFQVKRWIDMSQVGWWSGDHHIHAAGCAHYSNPTKGVLAPDMMRYCLGEDLNVGVNLTWGPCFDFQKQFFTGKDDTVSKFPFVLHYDIEVSGFGSHVSGHLCLLNLKDQIPPGGDSDKHWPTLGLNTLKWAKAQGAVCGTAHSGNGLQVESQELPNYDMPPFDGIGAQEYIVDVTHTVPGPDGTPVPAIDFTATINTAYPAEMNIWYHTLNAGYRPRISGETDFPCADGSRVGVGRSYVKLPPKWSYADWCEGIRAGRNYVTNGSGHLVDFKVNDVEMGVNGSELDLAKAGTVKVTGRVAAYVEEKADEKIKNSSLYARPYWEIERARIPGTSDVEVEVVVNGVAVAKAPVAADGKLHDVSWEVPLEHSSWVALRIPGAAHSNPIFVVVDQKPIRASRLSAEWCRKCVDKCWSQKESSYAPAEHAEAVAAYDHARAAYDQIIKECAQ